MNIIYIFVIINDFFNLTISDWHCIFVVIPKRESVLNSAFGLRDFFY